MNTIRKLKIEIAQLKSLKSERSGNQNSRFLDSQKIQFQNNINILKQDIDWLRNENLFFKQQNKELVDSNKMTLENVNKKLTSLINENENLKSQVKGKMLIVECECSAPVVSAGSRKYACKSVSISIPLRNNKSAHYDYLTYLKDCLEMLRETIEENKLGEQLESTITDACFLTNRSQELLEYAISTCPKINSKQDLVSSLPSMKNHKRVSFVLLDKTNEPSSSTQANHVATKQTNVPIIAST